jgi:trans-L-3-hydroxyproline dehydratase
VCSHATLALGRFLIDTHDPAIFPRRKQLPYDRDSKTTLVKIHAPCGVVMVTVPTKAKNINGEELHVSDPSKAVTFTSVPCYVPLLSYSLSIPPTHTWPQLQAAGKSSIRISIAYGGAFFCLVEAQELGFADGLRTKGVRLEDYDRATKTIKTLIGDDVEFCKRYLRHPDVSDLSLHCESSA